MFNIIKRYYNAWRFKKAVHKANELSQLLGIKYYVICLNGAFKVVPKQNIKKLIKNKRFRKGVTIHDIEKKALYVTR